MTLAWAIKKNRLCCVAIIRAGEPHAYNRVLDAPENSILIR
jgi:hypothetical protein